MSRSDTGRPRSALQADADKWRDQQPTVTRCGFCRWTHVGTAQEGRTAYTQHRTATHPDVKPRRIRRSTLNRFVGRDSDKSFLDEGNANAEAVARMHRRREGRAA